MRRGVMMEGDKLLKHNIADVMLIDWFDRKKDAILTAEW